MKISNNLYSAAVRRFVKFSFPFWQKFGVHVTLNHFYWPVPDTEDLKTFDWKKKTEMVGIDLMDKEQLDLLKTFEAKYKNEYDSFPLQPTSNKNDFHLGNPNFKVIDAEIYYSIIRQFKPSQIMEIGSGFTTLLAAQAIGKNKEENPGYNCILTAIEPYPRDFLVKGFPNFSNLVRKKVETVPLSFFETLKENDILFIDSSHILNTSSDVQYEFLEILPRLNKGVIIHVHDIFLPNEYPRDWVLKHYRFYTEQYLLQMFLSYNESYKILFGGNYMHTYHPDELMKAFKNYHPSKVNPGSFWLKKVK